VAGPVARARTTGANNVRVTNPSGDRQGGSRGTPAARLWSQASRRAADGLPGPVARSDSGHPHVRVTNSTQTATLETEICGQRLSAARAANGARRRPERLSRPTDATESRGNVGLFCGGGNHAKTRGLPGGAEGIRTDDHRGHSEMSSYSSVRPSMRSLNAAGAFSRSRSTPSARRGCYAAPAGWRRYAIIEPAPARTVDQPFVCQARKDRFGANCP
jgi:hypothetical protein